MPVDHTTSRLQAVTLLRLSRILNFIKGLIDAGEPLPASAPLSAEPLPPGTDRTLNGRILLGAFLHDYRVRGVLPDGRVYCHATDETLNRRFVEGLSRQTLRGTR
jgi:hypothetical protein